MIRAENLSVHFRKGLFREKIKAVDNFDLHIKEGEIFALIGQNGAGKSTAMYCMLGLLKPTSGSVKVFGKEPDLGSELYGKIAYLPEEPHYHNYLTVEEAISYYGSLYGKKVPSRRMDEILDMLDLEKFRDLRIQKCSKGMKQKVGLAQCMLGDPKLLFLDEPTRGLDPVTVKKLRDILLSMNKQGTTIVMNSHVMSEIEMVASHVAIVDKGRVVTVDDLQSLTATDGETYGVEFMAHGELPNYITVIKKTDGVIKGNIPSARLHDFWDYSKTHQVKVLTCSLKKRSLEDSFLNILKEKNGHA